MTFLNFTFQETSPLIEYSGWVIGSPSNDTFSADYGSSFMVTFMEGATAAFTFTGTAVSLFGALRPNHGNYTVELDQDPTFEAFGGGPNIFNRSLWHADGLEYATHTVALTNKPTAQGVFLDINYVSIGRQIGQDGDHIFQTTIDDTSPSVSYSGNWEATTGIATAYQGTLHSTDTANAQVVISFTGCCVELYGNYANAPYQVTVDNQIPVNLAGLDVDLTPDQQHPQTLLYLVDGLSESNHTIKLTNINSNSNRPFFFDNAVVSSIHEPSSGTTFNSTAPVQMSSQKNTGIIAGAVVGSAVALIALLLLVFFWRRRRRRLADRPPTPAVIEASAGDPVPFVIPNHAQSSSTHPNGGIRPTPGLGNNMPPSKLHQRADYYPQNGRPSEENLLHSRQQSSASSREPGSYYVAGSSTEPSVTMSQTSASRPVSASERRTRRGTSSRHTPRGSKERTVQEEDAGIVIESSEETSLPPAYNPSWGRREGR